MADDGTKTKNTSSEKQKKNAKSDEKKDGLTGMAAGMASNVKMPEMSKAGVSEFFRKYWRVLKLARRPTKDEFFKISAVSAVGIALIGVIGFIIYLIFHYLLP